jgi:hypothetical protein
MISSGIDSERKNFGEPATAAPAAGHPGDRQEMGMSTGASWFLQRRNEVLHQIADASFDRGVG